MTVNYEFINDMINENDNQNNELDIEQSINAFSKITFQSEMMTNKDK